MKAIDSYITEKLLINKDSIKVNNSENQELYNTIYSWCVDNLHKYTQAKFTIADPDDLDNDIMLYDLVFDEPVDLRVRNNICKELNKYCYDNAHPDIYAWPDTTKNSKKIFIDKLE